MFRDIFVASINKGQFLSAIFGIIILVTIWRLPPEELSVIVKDIMKNLINGWLLGYSLFGLTVFAWFLHSKRLRTLATTEQKRLGDEKNELQKRAGLKEKVRSSKRK